MQDATAELIAAVTQVLCAAAEARGEPPVPRAAASALVAEHLPGLHEALEASLVTTHEVAGAITDRFVVWLAAHAGRRFVGTDASWAAVVDDVQAILDAPGHA